MSKEENNKKLLKDLGFKITSKGFKYWLLAIEIHKTKKNKFSYSMQELYEEIGKRFKVTGKSVEMAMRTCSENSKKKIKEYYNFNEKLTQKIILELIVDFKREYYKLEEINKHIPFIF